MAHQKIFRKRAFSGTRLDKNLVRVRIGLTHHVTKSDTLLYLTKICLHALKLSDRAMVFCNYLPLLLILLFLDSDEKQKPLQLSRHGPENQFLRYLFLLLHH